MDDLWRLDVYRRELKKHLPAECFQPVPRRLWWMPLHVGIAGVGIAAIALADLHWGANLALALCVGLSFASLGFLAHEILHGSVVANRLLRAVTGSICFLPLLTGARVWRKWHNAEHHGRVQQEGDPDSLPTLESLGNRPVVRAFWRVPWRLRAFLLFAGYSFWFSLHSFQMMLRYRASFRPRARLLAVGQYVAAYAVWLALLGAVGPERFLFAYVIPLAVANAVVLSYITTNHMLNPLTTVNDPLRISLTVTVPRWMDVLHLEFSHHAEHHIFPRMCHCHHPLVKALVKERWPERYNEMPLWKALRTLWLTPRVHRGDDELIDPGRNLVFPVLGAGLDPDHVVGRPTA